MGKKRYIAAKYQKSSIPTIMMFKKGEIVMRHAGALTYDALKSEVELRL